MKKGIVCQEIRTEIRTGQLDNDYRLKSCKVNKIRVVEYRKQPVGWNSKEIVSRGTNILPGISNKSWGISHSRIDQRSAVSLGVSALHYRAAEVEGLIIEW